MMFVAVSTRTMARAVVVPDEEPKRNFDRRARLIEVSRRWIERTQPQQKLRKKTRRESRIEAAIERLRIEAGSPPRTSAQSIIGQVAAWHGLHSDDLTGPSRLQNMVIARHDAIAAVKTNCTMRGKPLSLSDLGRLFNRDHTTILHALRKRGLMW